MSDDALSNFNECFDLLSNVYDQVNGEDFYRYIFPNNENAGEMYTDFSHPNAIYLYHDFQDDGSNRHLRRRIMLNDTWADDYRDYVEGNGMTDLIYAAALPLNGDACVSKSSLYKFPNGTGLIGCAAAHLPCQLMPHFSPRRTSKERDGSRVFRAAPSPTEMSISCTFKTSWGGSIS